VWSRQETHVVVALWHLLEYSEAEATERIRIGIQRYNAANGLRGYHETVTLASIRLIVAYLDRVGRRAPLPELAVGLLGVFPTSYVLLEHYSKERIMSPAARTEWLEPDIKPFAFGHA